MSSVTLTKKSVLHRFNSAINMPYSLKTKLILKKQSLERQLSVLHERARLIEEEIEEIADIVSFKGPYKMKRDNERFFSDNDSTSL